MLTFLIILAVAIYLLPTIVGALLGVRGLLVILLVNVFLGWTIAGWAVAAMWVLQRSGLIGARDRDERDIRYDDRRMVR